MTGGASSPNSNMGYNNASHGRTATGTQNNNSAGNMNSGTTGGTNNMGTATR
jgi:hypothetical protein